MSKLVQRAAALVVMVAVTMGATVWGVSSTTIHYKNIQSDAPVVRTVNGEEHPARMIRGHDVQLNMEYYNSMYASFGLTDVWSNEELAPQWRRWCSPLRRIRWSPPALSCSTSMKRA